MNLLQISDIDIKQLRVFAAIVEHEGMTEAANTLNISLAHVSRTLTDLENRLGMRLCLRGRGGFELTSQGGEVYEASKQLFEQLDRFSSSISAVRHVVSGHIKVGIIDNVLANPEARIEALLAKLKRQFPDIFVSILMFRPSAIEVAVRERRIDVGFVGAPEFLQSLSYSKAFTEEYRMYALAGGAVEHECRRLLALGSDIGKAGYVARQYRTLAFVEIERRYNLVPTCLADSVEAAATGILAGLGVGILPTHYAEAVGPDRLTEIALEGMPLRTQFYMIHRNDGSNGAVVKALRNLL